MRQLELKHLTMLVLGMLLLSAPCLFAETDVLNSATGVIQVFVEDESGAAVPNAPIFITDGKRMHYLETGSLGSASMTLQDGNYRVSSAVTKPQAIYMDRFASSEARATVSAQENTSIILTLRQVSGDPVGDLSASDLKTMGISGEFARYNN